VRSEERDRFYTLLGRGRLVRNFEALMRVHSGDLRNLQVSAELLEINGETHLLTFAVDVTEQRRAEQVLRDAEARTRALYETISAAAMVHDESGFIQVNSAAVKLFGAERVEDIVGLHPGQVSPPVQPDGESSFVKAQRHMARAMAEGRHRFEWVCRKLDGTEFPVEVTLTTLELGGRRVMQAVVLDLTERKRAETELQNALEKERELSQLKSDFVSLVSHEFRTPLEIIMSSADNLQRYHDRLAAEKREQLLSTIHKSVRRMAGMMEEVLVLGRLETERMTFKPAAFDLRAFCQRVCDEIESAKTKRCPIRLQMNGSPEQAIGDESVLRHILSNLLSNAVKYSPAGQSVDLIVQREGDDVACRIVDRGCGIPQADQKRLFQAFHRGSNVRQIPGTGLGLLIVQRCVELHGGTIQFESIEGQGTTFTVKLPLFAQAAAMNPEI
jgi:PAS domain S-box-containing protein